MLRLANDTAVQRRARQGARKATDASVRCNGGLGSGVAIVGVRNGSRDACHALSELPKPTLGLVAGFLHGKGPLDRQGSKLRLSLGGVPPLELPFLLISKVAVQFGYPLEAGSHRRV